MIIYMDVLFLINFIMDYLLLSLTAMLRGYYLPLRRRLLGGIVGALTAAGVFFLPWDLPDGLLAVPSCMLMVWATWGRADRRRFAADCAMLWLLSMLFSGGVLLLAQWSGSGMARGGAVYFNLSVGVLVVGTIVAYGVLTLCWRPGSLGHNGAQREISCSLHGREVRFRAFEDSGNLLRDSFGRGIILLSPSLAQELLAIDIEKIGSAEELFLVLADQNKAGLLPYQTVGTRSLLVTLQPDMLTVDGVVRDDYILGLAARELEGAGGCRALIGC